MKELLTKLDGGKTYLITIVAIGYAFFGFAYGAIDANTMMQIILGALGVSGLRSGIKKAEK